MTNSHTRGPSLAIQVPLKSLVPVEAVEVFESVVVIVPLEGFPAAVGESLVDFFLQPKQAISKSAMTIVFFTVVLSSVFFIKRGSLYKRSFIASIFHFLSALICVNPRLIT